jgi:predicted pyridoxine 5'-phosphate oxidase superfamily flavin-nucleotide-binding protein
MKPEDFYHDASRALQRGFGTLELAGHLAERYVLEELEPEHADWIRGADSVFVATLDPHGQPECSYKGGLPGFIRVTGPRSLEIPSYDGNGMYRTLGNAASGSRIGLLFLFPEQPAKLRVNGTCELLTDPAALAAHHGAEAVVRVGVTAVFENCPRYLHDRRNGGYSVHCPRPGYRPPDPDWKFKPEYDGLLPDPPTAEGRTP